MKKRERIEALEARMNTVELACGLRELQPPAPAAPEPYPWHADVLSGKVDIAGGLVEVPEDAQGIVRRRSGDDLWVVETARGEYTVHSSICELAQLRPARRDWAVGDTALVVSTAATEPKHGLGSIAAGQRHGIQSVEDDGSVYGNDGMHYEPSDLLYIPPADPPSFREPTATAEREMTAHLRDVMPSLREQVDNWLSDRDDDSNPPSGDMQRLVCALTATLDAQAELPFDEQGTILAAQFLSGRNAQREASLAAVADVLGVKHG